MNISHRADVIIASPEFRADFDEQVANAREAIANIEAVDIAPDPDRRIVVLAPTKQAGREHADALSIDPIAIVTPRSPYGARGSAADEIVEAEGLTAEERDALMIEVAPTLATSQAGEAS